MAITPSSGAANLLAEEWAPSILTAANEEMRIANNFTDANDLGGVSKFGNKLHVRKIATISATELAASGTGLSLTYSAPTDTDVTVSPLFIYAAVELSPHTLTRVIHDSKLKAAYRTQIAAGLSTKIDTEAGELASGLTTNVKGSSASNIDKALLLDAVGSLVSSSKDKFSPGKAGWAYFCYTPTQYKHVHAISEITNAQIRGDSEKPVQVGWVWDAYGLRLCETGNVHTSAGTAYNMIHLKDAFVLGYNLKPEFLAPQDYELVTRIISRAEFGVQELWDEYAVLVQTSTT